MKKFFFSILLIFLIFFFLSESVYSQGKTVRATNLYVNRKIDGRGGIPFWWNGFIYGNYAGTTYDAIRWDYTGSGNLILNLLADGSPVLTLTKSGTLTIDSGASTGIAFSGNIDQDNQEGFTFTSSADTDGDNTFGIRQTVNTGTGVMSDSGGILLREAIGIRSDVTIAADESTTDGDYARGIGIYNDISVTGKQGWGVGVWNNFSDLSGGNYAQVSGIYNWASTGVTVSSLNYLYTMKNFINPDGFTNGGLIYGLHNQLYGMGIDTGTGYIYGIDSDIIASLYDTGSGDVEAYGFRSAIRMEAADFGYHVHITDGDLSTGGTEYGLYIDLDDADVTSYSIWVESGSGDTVIGSEIVWTPSADQIINAVGDAILANGPIIFLDPDGDYTLTSTPTIADGAKGQILKIMSNNGETNIVTIQDQDSLGGSNLQLQAASRSISGKDVLNLVFDGTDWLEESYADN